MPRFLLSLTAEEDDRTPAIRSGAARLLTIHDGFLSGRRCRVHQVYDAYMPDSSAGGLRRLSATPAIQEFGFYTTSPDWDVSVALHETAVRITVPILAARQVYCYSSAHGVWVADDQRLLYRRGMSIDPHSIYSLLRLYDVIPPFGIWQGISRVSPGTEIIIDAVTLRIVETVSVREAGPPRQSTDAATLEQLEGVLLDAMDSVLNQASPKRRAVVLFTGGVDSGMIAARLADCAGPKRRSSTVAPARVNSVHHICSCVCQKAYSVFDRSPLRLVFPFLTPDLMGAILHGINPWLRNEWASKAVIKRALARRVPPSMVYRKKSGFTVPPSVTFSDPLFLARFDEVLETTQHPLTDWLKRDTLIEMRSRLERREPLAFYTYEFLWALVFGFHWIRRAESSTVAA
jgi:hypothetical protein